VFCCRWRHISSAEFVYTTDDTENAPSTRKSANKRRTVPCSSRASNLVRKRERARETDRERALVPPQAVPYTRFKKSPSKSNSRPKTSNFGKRHAHKISFLVSKRTFVNRRKKNCSTTFALAPRLTARCTTFARAYTPRS
jgi:hypothetical protein